MTRPTLRSALAAQVPLVTPLAHDALSARLIERAGFRGFAIGGSAMLAARFGLPDLGLIGLADMVAGSRQIAEATDLPFLIDGDDGYGDARNVARMVDAYERLGAGGILIEDQERAFKQQRAERALRVADLDVILDKLRAALSARSSADTFIIGRTDAYGALGLDEALRRAERFLGLGVDGVFVAGLRQHADYERVGRELKGANLSAAIFDGGGTPWLSPAELGEMGFRHVSFPSTLILRAVDAMAGALEGLAAHARGEAPLQPYEAAGRARHALDEAVKLTHWTSLMQRAPDRPAGEGAAGSPQDNRLGGTT